jgi:hypothetical protein
MKQDQPDGPFDEEVHQADVLDMAMSLLWRMPSSAMGPRMMPSTAGPPDARDLEQEPNRPKST